MGKGRFVRGQARWSLFFLSGNRPDVTAGLRVSVRRRLARRQWPQSPDNGGGSGPLRTLVAEHAV